MKLIRWGIPPAYIDQLELSDYNDWIDAGRALDYDDQMRTIRNIELSQPVTGEAVRVRQAQLNEISIGRDKLLCEIPDAPLQIDARDEQAIRRNREIASRIGKIQRVKKIDVKKSKGIIWQPQHKK